MVRVPQVLVVEDDPDVRDLLTLVLAYVGRVTTCRDAYEALVRARTERIDVLVTDLVLPGANAVEMLERMARIGVRPPTIVLTGFPQPALVERLRRLGVEHVLEKPADLDRLTQLVRDAADVAEDALLA